MNENDEKRQVAIGKYLTILRETAGLTQAELAKKLTFSAAQISRIESDHIQIPREERDKILDAIGGENARKFSEYLIRDWNEIERPPFDHTSQDVLWSINELLGKLRKLKADPELKGVFVPHIENYEKELRLLAGHLCSTEHNIAFVGSIGVGKSTAICLISDLRVSNQGPPNKQMVLEAGGGGVTICEVHVKSGPQYGFIIEPRSAESIRFDVADFAEYLLRLTNNFQQPVEGIDEEGPAITKEINRAIRCMSNLVAEKAAKDSKAGLVSRTDPARELAMKHSDSKELVVQILSRMNLSRRDRRSIWYSPEAMLPPLEWLQKTFTEINNGRHPEFSLPQRIEVVIPCALLDELRLDLRIVDTKGIDAAAARADLDGLFDDPRTVVVLCSRFNDAPENALQQLLQRVKDAGARDITQKAIVLVLPRPEEAMAVKDDSGMSVENDQEGYDLKRADVEMRLTQLGLQSISIEFFNARNDAPTLLRTVLLSRVREVRATWGRRASALEMTVEDLILNHKKKQTEAVFKEVMHRLNTWLSKNREVGNIAEQAQQELVKAIHQAHWRSVWASVRRRGDWDNLSYYHQLGYGARTIAAKHILKKISAFEIIVQNLLDDKELAPAHQMLEQTRQLLHSKADEVLKNMEIAGKEAFADDLKADTEFWNALQMESGTGYRDRIMSSSDQWFKIAHRIEKQGFVRAKILESWTEILNELNELFGTVGSS
jgi:transcriptional regulator with XRE-family HTH domain